MSAEFVSRETTPLSVYRRTLSGFEIVDDFNEAADIPLIITNSAIFALFVSHLFRINGCPL